MSERKSALVPGTTIRGKLGIVCVLSLMSLVSCGKGQSNESKVDVDAGGEAGRMSAGATGATSRFATAALLRPDTTVLGQDLTAESADARISIDSISASSVSEETRCLLSEDEHLPIQLTDAQVNDYTSIVARRMPNAWAFNGTTRVTIDEADAPGVFPSGYGYVGCMMKVNRDEGANPPKLFITRHGRAKPDRPTRFTLQASTWS